ncbi:hypothetical protein BJ973_007470 [Actinoplanes tereljensis]|uniref:Lipoprotein n=1 Tax=Paractinoplanes tereljensis TaxID=571912 RepID=A0A919TVU3_9ACTN|nr:hypothetical protein [Actinoplanes tereljensis]GIF25218.1 hypothetical protein Ate02nite_79480 [Actinoplanes tereljensis]
MRPHLLPLSVAALLVGCVAACGGTPEASPTPSASAPTGGNTAPDARAELAATAALAADKAYAALYTLDDDGSGRQHNVVATIAADGTWRVDVSDAMLGGTTDVSIVSTAAGVYQCTVSSPSNPVTPTCVKVAPAGKRVAKDNSPQVERLFRLWLPVFRDRQAALSVAEVQPLSGAQGACYSIDSIAASIKAPVDIGIYCYSADGVLTAARVGFGVLKLVSQVVGPATVALPGAEVPGPAMGQDALPPPAVDPTPSDLVPSA